MGSCSVGRAWGSRNGKLLRCLFCAVALSAFGTAYAQTLSDLAKIYKQKYSHLNRSVAFWSESSASPGESAANPSLVTHENTRLWRKDGRFLRERVGTALDTKQEPYKVLTRVQSDGIRILWSGQESTSGIVRGPSPEALIDELAVTPLGYAFLTPTQDTTPGYRWSARTDIVTLLEQPDTRIENLDDSSNGGACVVVSWGPPEFPNVRVWLDPSLAYAVIRRVGYYPNSSKKFNDVRLEGYVESPCPGLFVPTEAELTSYAEESKVDSVTRWKNIRVTLDADIGDDVFSLPFPGGADVYDETNDLHYIHPFKALEEKPGEGRIQYPSLILRTRSFAKSTTHVQGGAKLRLWGCPKTR